MTLLYYDPLFLEHRTGAHPERPQRLQQVVAHLARTGLADRCTSAHGEPVTDAALASRILPRVDAFSPDLIILCAGFDAHLHDPLGGLRFVAEDFGDVTLRVMEIAARRCKGRIVSLLEGGYRLEDLARSAAAHVGALMQA